LAKLYFYYSAMNAGKSTNLLQSSHNYQERGMETMLFAPQFDTRFGDPAIYSRIGLKQDAILFDDDLNFYCHVEEAAGQTTNLKCILIDEAHFLRKRQVAQLVEITSEIKIPVLAFGLRSDFLGEPFEGSKYLLAWAHELVEIKTICHCGRKATMNLRIDHNGKAVTHGNQVQIGGNESYISTCIHHFREVHEIFRNYALEKTSASTRDNS